MKIARRLSNIAVTSVTASSALLTAALFSLGGTSLQSASADGDTRTLTLHHIHTNEDITITYKRNGRYDEDALKKLNWFVRDWRKQEEIRMDPQLFDVIWEASREVAGDKTIYVVCGYRSPATNAMLRARSNGVAEFSQHTLGKAMDFYIPGASLEELRYAGLRLQRGGVGYYPTSGSPFVHLDVGSVRHWPRMSHDELARVFPSGRTVHVPSDDRPLPGYALALADIAKRGSSPPSQSSPGAARAVGAEPAAAPPRKNVLAALSKKGEDGSDAASSRGGRKVAGNKIGERPAASAAASGPRSPGPGYGTEPLPSTVLAYAPQTIGPELAPVRRSTTPGQNVTVVAKKSATRQPVMQPVARSEEITQTARAGTRYDDPWLRAIILAPSLSDAMTATLHGDPDMASLRSLMNKPASTMALSFTNDPYAGITADHFSGDAVVFVATTKFPRRTASLR